MRSKKWNNDTNFTKPIFSNFSTHPNFHTFLRNIIINSNNIIIIYSSLIISMHLSPQAPLIHKTPQAKIFDSIYEHKFINKSL